MKKAIDIIDNARIIGFDASDGLMLYGMIREPRRHGKSAILHIHGLHGNFYGSNSIAEIAKEANKKGIAFMSIQTRGSYIVEGFSYKNKRQELLAGGALEKFEDSIYDIDGGINALIHMGYKQIFLEGHSTGCQKVLYYLDSGKYQSHKRNITGIALLGPVDDYNYDRLHYGNSEFRKMTKLAEKRRGKELFMPIGPNATSNSIIGVKRFLSTVLEKNPEAEILNYRGDLKYIKSVRVPMLAVFGSNDEYMVDTKPRRAIELLKEKYSGKRIETYIVKGAGHTFRGKRIELARTVVRFYSEL